MRDGWRHLRYLLLAAPDFLFTLPGAALIVLGAIATTISLASPEGIQIGPLTWRPVFAGTILLAIGVNALLFGVIAKLFGVSRGLLAEDHWSRLYRRWFKLEVVLAIAALLFLAGFAAGAHPLRGVDDERGPGRRSAARRAGADADDRGRGARLRRLPAGDDPVAMSDRRLRIAFVYDALFPYVKGGAERRYHELARRLSQRHDVHMVSWTWWDGAPDESLNGLTLHGVGKPPALYGTDGKRTIREAAAFSARALPTLLRGRWDVIDCSATPYLPLASHLARLAPDGDAVDRDLARVLG